MNIKTKVLEQGKLSFSIESRIIRELGERLVKQPQIALLELIKNAYDADAHECLVEIQGPGVLAVKDDGRGMTLDEFKNGWMRIGTSSKESRPHSELYGRVITGEKGIGRFAVRYLGQTLRLESIAFDRRRGYPTLLTAAFHWPSFDKNEDLGKIEVPYTLERAEENSRSGTKLVISDLRPGIPEMEMRSVKTGAIDIVSPYQTLINSNVNKNKKARPLNNQKLKIDPGFSVKIKSLEKESLENKDLAAEVLDNFILRSIAWTENDRLHLEIYKKGNSDPVVQINDKIDNFVGNIFSDIRFFPQRSGTFRGLGVDGKRAKAWVKENSGVAVFDRSFRVHPYGTSGDDWLKLSADKAKNLRKPRSPMALRHFPMSEEVERSTLLNYMLKLPYPEQLVGVVRVEGKRNLDTSNPEIGLIPAADREGFLNNQAYVQLFEIVRGSIEALASVDRDLQLKEEQRKEEETAANLKEQTQEAIKEIQSNPNIAKPEKVRIIKYLTHTQVLADRKDELSKQRAATLEVMSLLGVVSGFMTHEFGTALDVLDKAYQHILKISRKDENLKEYASLISDHIASLNEFVTYSQGYIHGASSTPVKPFPSRPRISQVIRVFGKYAEDRRIKVSIEISPDLQAPLVPVSLYNGIALNLFTNALKAVTAKQEASGRREIAFRAWNDSEWHFLEVSDTGIGIPTSLKSRVFDPLFTTTAKNTDPLGSGMGLGLSLVKRGAEAFGGKVELVDPPPEFSTCFRLRIPLAGDDND